MWDNLKLVIGLKCCLLVTPLFHLFVCSLVCVKSLKHKSTTADFLFQSNKTTNCHEHLETNNNKFKLTTNRQLFAYNTDDFGLPQTQTDDKRRKTSPQISVIVQDTNYQPVVDDNTNNIGHIEDGDHDRQQRNQSEFFEQQHANNLLLRAKFAILMNSLNNQTQFRQAPNFDPFYLFNLWTDPKMKR